MSQGGIILALMYQILSELCSYSCLGESCTRMGDLLGSPHVAPFLVFVFFYLNSGASTLFSSRNGVSTFHMLCFCFVNLYVSHSN